MSDEPPNTATLICPSPGTQQPCAPDDAHTRPHQRLAMLHELSEIGMRLARRVEPQEPDTGDVGLVFSRIARAVRQTLALEARLEAELAGLTRQAAAERERAAEQAARAPYYARSRIVRRAVVRAIEADTDDDDVEQLVDDLDERLCDREDDADFLDRPIGELVASICRDLGVRADLSLWEDEAWAIAEAAARTPPAAPDAAEPLAQTHDPPPIRPRAAPSPGWLSG